jgi:hypothetical protein
MLVFTNKSCSPSQSDVENSLGEKIHLFNSVLNDSGINATEWKFYSRSSGWTLQCRQNVHNLFYIQITESGFFVWFTLGRQAIITALELLKNEDLKKEIMTAKEYREGTSFKVHVTLVEDLPVISLLTGLKSKTATK